MKDNFERPCGREIDCGAKEIEVAGEVLGDDLIAPRDDGGKENEPFLSRGWIEDNAGFRYSGMK
jgi:hypothetical protein